MEKLDELTIITARVWGDPKKLPDRMTPYRYPRPHGRTRERPKPSTPAEIRRFFRGK